MERVFTKYLFGARVLSSSVNGFMFTTPEMKMGGGFGSVLWLGESSTVSSIKCAESIVCAYGFSEPVVGLCGAWGCAILCIPASFLADCLPVVGREWGDGL